MAHYGLDELARVSGASRFTIRSYVNLALIPPADGAGGNRHYTDRHLHMLLAIRRLRAEGLRDTALRARLASTSESEMRVLAGVEAPAPPEAPPVDAAPPARSDDALHRAVHAVVAALADAMDLPPKRVRPGLAAALARMKDEGLGVDEVVRVLAEGATGG